MNEKNEEKALILGRKKIGRLLINYALPAVVAQIASSLYNVIDRIFIGQGVDAMAISGLALTFPFMNLAAAFGALVGVSAATMVSIKLGEKDYDTARLVLGNVIILNIIFGVGFTLVCLPFLEPILYALGGSPQTVPYTKDYMFVILIGNVFHPSVPRIELRFAFFRLSGKSNVGYHRLCHHERHSCRTLHLCFRLGNFRSGMGDGVDAGNDNVRFDFYAFEAKDCCTGLCHRCFSFCDQPCGLFGCHHLQYQFEEIRRRFGDRCIRHSQFGGLYVPYGCAWCNAGNATHSRYNYGAKRMDRVLKCLKLSLVLGGLVTTVGFMASEFIPGLLASAFTTDRKLIDLSVIGFRILMAMSPIIGLQVVAASFFQSVGFAKKAIFLSLTRQLIFLISGLLIFPLFMGLNGVCFACPMLINDVGESGILYALLYIVELPLVGQVLAYLNTFEALV